MTRSSLIFWMALSAMALWIGACAADPDADQPGTCSLSCSNAKLGDFTTLDIRTVTQTATASCPVAGGGGATAVEASAPVTLKWSFTETFTPDEPKTSSTGDEDEGAVTFPGTPFQMPKSGIRFEPVVSGAVWFPRTNGEHLDGNGNPTPAKYGGVVTSKDEWCTDTCGIATIEVWPACNSGSGSIDVMLLSGGANVDHTLIRITTN